MGRSCQIFHYATAEEDGDHDDNFEGGWWPEQHLSSSDEGAAYSWAPGALLSAPAASLGNAFDLLASSGDSDGEDSQTSAGDMSDGSIADHDGGGGGSVAAATAASAPPELSKPSAGTFSLAAAAAAMDSGFGDTCCSGGGELVAAATAAIAPLEFSRPSAGTFSSAAAAAAMSSGFGDNCCCDGGGASARGTNLDDAEPVLLPSHKPEVETCELVKPPSDRGVEAAFEDASSLDANAPAFTLGWPPLGSYISPTGHLIAPHAIPITDLASLFEQQRQILQQNQRIEALVTQIQGALRLDQQHS